MTRTLRNSGLSNAEEDRIVTLANYGHTVQEISDILKIPKDYIGLALTKLESEGKYKPDEALLISPTAMEYLTTVPRGWIEQNLEALGAVDVCGRKLLRRDSQGLCIELACQSALSKTHKLRPATTAPAPKKPRKSVLFNKQPARGKLNEPLWIHLATAELDRLPPPAEDEEYIPTHVAKSDQYCIRDSMNTLIIKGLLEPQDRVAIGPNGVTSMAFRKKAVEIVHKYFLAAQEERSSQK